MRVKKECLILTFPTTVAAMQCEKYCIAHGISGRIIPVPREISAGCGLAWCAGLEHRDALKEIMSSVGIEEEEMHECMV